MKVPDLLEAFDLNAIIGIDFETYFDDDYSLKKMATTDYIVDPRFKMQMASVRRHDARKAQVFNQLEFAAFCRETDWKRTGMLAHHTHFDGLILSHHFNTVPAMYFDTLSMARPLMPIQVGGSLKKLCAAFGREAKKRAGALQDVKGVRDFTPAQYKALAKYAGDDITETWWLFHKLLPFLPKDELKLIDLTVKMYARPTVLIDKGMAEKVRDDEIEKKQALLKKVHCTATQILSNPQFEGLLAAEGVIAPMKMSAATNEPTLAMAKTDLQFLALLKHPKKRVRDLMETRMAVKSTLLEKRSDRMAARSVLGPQPIYLNYAGAHTWRWSGGDKMNWQNLTKGANLREAIHAPKGYVFIIADQAQIEARLNAWRCGQLDMLEAFRNKQDVYAMQATKIYGRHIDKDKNPLERFLGKVCVLALGYGAGYIRFVHMLATGQFGPPVIIPLDEGKTIVYAWRAANSYIIGGWKKIENFTRSAFLGSQTLKDDLLTYSGSNGNGYIHFPGGMVMRYDGVRADGDGMTYIANHNVTKKGVVSIKRTCLHGGFLTENVTQGLGRLILATQMAAIDREAPDCRIVTTTHDEVLLAVPKKTAKKTLHMVTDIMTTPLPWCPDLPFAVDAHISPVYDKG